MYMNVYTAVHNFCVSYNTMPNTRFQQSTLARGAQLLGSDLYTKFEEYLNQHLQGLRKAGAELAGEQLILYYDKCWERYTTGAKYLNHIFDYLNRHWVRREREEGRKNVHDVNTLCLVRWKAEMFDELEEPLVQAILEQIGKQRDGVLVSPVSIKKAVDSFVSLGLDEQNTKRTSTVVYTDHFEVPFLRVTSDYYTRESAEFLATHSVVEYMKKAQTRLNEEAQRVRMYLHPTTDEKLVATCERVLIADHAKVIQDEFLPLLQQDRENDYRRVYELLSRIEDGLVPIQDTFQNYVKQKGEEAVEKLVAESQGESIDPRDYVNALLQVHTKFTEIVHKIFENNPSLVKSFDDGCRAFINRNAIATPKTAKARDSRTPELLAKYSDSLLKKSSKNTDEEDVDSSLSGIMTIFQYIDAKDAFEKYYTRLLSKRLVHNNSASEDAETNMVAKLKSACGYEYVHKLQRMFQDIALSQEMQQEFKSQLTKDSKEGIDFQVLVLATNFWPLPKPQTSFNLPRQLYPVFERFKGFYSGKHSGRKLQWLWNFSKGEMKAKFATNKVVYTFQVSAYQMALLLPYNDADEYTIEQLEEISNLSKDVLNGSLGILVKARVLVQKPADAALGSPGTSYALNFDLKLKKVRVNLNLPLKLEQKQETEETQKHIEEDRKHFLQAVIVRVMKARKELKHVQLVQETIEQSKKRFKPEISEIKRCIDALIEREYLRRIEGSKYQYVA